MQRIYFSRSCKQRESQVPAHFYLSPLIRRKTSLSITLLEYLESVIKEVRGHTASRGERPGPMSLLFSDHKLRKKHISNLPLAVLTFAYPHSLPEWKLHCKEILDYDLQRQCVENSCLPWCFLFWLSMAVLKILLSERSAFLDNVVKKYSSEGSSPEKLYRNIESLQLIISS